MPRQDQRDLPTSPSTGGPQAQRDRGQHGSRSCRGQETTSAIPIVMFAASDPVGAGFVANLGRPGGRVTGLTRMSSELGVKRLQLQWNWRRGTVCQRCSSFARMDWAPDRTIEVPLARMHRVFLWVVPGDPQPGREPNRGQALVRREALKRTACLVAPSHSKASTDEKNGSTFVATRSPIRLLWSPSYSSKRCEIPALLNASVKSRFAANSPTI